MLSFDYFIDLRVIFEYNDSLNFIAISQLDNCVLIFWFIIHNQFLEDIVSAYNIFSKKFRDCFDVDVD
jgi:hypothetical protein